MRQDRLSSGQTQPAERPAMDGWAGTWLHGCILAPDLKNVGCLTTTRPVNQLFLRTTGRDAGPDRTYRDVYRHKPWKTAERPAMDSWAGT